MTDLMLTIDLARLRGVLQRKLDVVLQNVTLGLAGVNAHPDGGLKMPGAGWNFQLWKPPVASTETKSHFATWVIGMGMRNALEALDEFLHDIRFLAGCARETHAGGILHDGGLLAEVQQAVRRRQLKKFSKANWPRKIDSLKRKFGFAFELADELLSLQRARNCLVHRWGVVDEADTKGESALRVQYRAIELIRKSPDGTEYPVGVGAIIEMGHDLYVRTMVSKEKTFELGERIVFTASEFVQIIHTLFVAGELLLKEFGEYCGKLGLNVRSEEAKEDPGHEAV